MAVSVQGKRVSAHNAPTQLDFNGTVLDLGTLTDTQHLRRNGNNIDSEAAPSGGIAAVGAQAVDSLEHVSQAGPASYSAGGFSVTFSNLTTLRQAAISQVVGGTEYIFVISSIATNVATVKAFRALDVHDHDFNALSGTPSMGDEYGTSAGNDITQNSGPTIPGGGASGDGVRNNAAVNALTEVANATNLSGVTLHAIGIGDA